MKRCRAPLLVCLALTTANSFAREPQAPPSPSVDGAAMQGGTIKKGSEGNSIYFGHYGEAIEFPYGWTAEAEMRGETEVVYFHRKSHDDFGYKPFRPKPSDYKLENFAPMGLMELVVVPKNAPGGLRSLKDILRAKEKELKQNGVDYRISQVTSDTHWPLGTFHVEALRPYRLVQTYAESPKEFYILTVGGRLKEGDFGLSGDRVLDYDYADNLVSRSLGNHLLAVDKKTLREYLFNIAPDMSGRLLSQFNAVRLWALYGAFGAAMLVLAVWPGTSLQARRAHLFGYSLLLFPILLASMGFLIVYIPIRFGGVIWRHAEDATIIPVLMLPWMGWLAARRFGSAHTKRVLVLTGCLVLLWTAAMTLGPRSKYSESAGDLIFWNTIILHLVGLIYGFAFAFAFGPLSRKEKQL